MRFELKKNVSKLSKNDLAKIKGGTDREYVIIVNYGDGIWRRRTFSSFDSASAFIAIYRDAGFEWKDVTFV